MATSERALRSEAEAVALVEAANSGAVSGPDLGEVGPEIEGEISAAL